ncbi:uncharacterized protein [Miscanthus floridulus]|uniref:uncharacterized protein n=1 Tax=Miscanthus floridulus TaxID=154761 RepID=UPI00345AA62D
MSNKRHRCELEPCCQCHRAAKRFKQQKKHLYLILDDWERGYSVYKVDVDAFDPSDAGPESLPEHPVVRFEARHGRSWYFASHGTKILAMQPSPYPAFPVFDVQTTALAVCPWPGRGGNKLSSKPLFASVAGSLYLLRGGHFDMLSAVAPPPDSTYPEDAGWSWSRVGSPPPFDHCHRIWSFVLHPDGRTFFVSHDRRTFSFDTESREWVSHGNWFLPFKDEAYFDAELDAWVGLCCHEGGLGYLCCCDVAPASADLTSLPAWKLGKDQLFDAKSRRHLGATLVCMGSSRYCLVESLARDDEEDLRRLHNDGYYPHRRVLAVTTFGLEYDGQGQLVTTQRKVRSYEMTDAHQFPDPHWKPVAFWM